MRSWWGWAALAVLLLQSAAIPAQTAPVAPAPLVEDPAGDVTLGGAAADGSGTYAVADLRALRAAADLDSIDWTVEVASLASDLRLASSINYDVRLDVETLHYRILFERNLPVDGPVRYWGQVAVYDDGARDFRILDEPEVTADAAAGTMTLTTPLALLVGPTGLPARAGSVLPGISVRSTLALQDPVTSFPSPPLVPEIDRSMIPQAVSDRMPDRDAVSWLIDIPVASTRQVLFDSPDPVRATNGGPGTFVFPLRATNQGSTPVDVLPTVAGLPQGWSASVVDPRLTLGAQQTRLTSVVVQPPGIHSHGDVVNITVQALGADGAPVGDDAVLQLRYSNPPQPSGHHPTLYLHALNPPEEFVPFRSLADTVTEPTLGLNSRLVVMNANSEDERDVGKAVNQDYDATGPCFCVAMSPGLGMGLDFVPGAVARFTGRFSSANAVPIEDLRLEAQLVLTSPDGETLLASAPESPPQAVSKDAPKAFELALTMTPEADYVPYGAKSNLELRVRPRYTDPGGIGATVINLEAGASLTLPLLEYQDLIPLQAVGALEVAAQPDLLPGNPGDHLLFDLVLRNVGGAAFDVSLAPLDVSAASIVAIGPAKVRIGAGDTAHASVEVVVPTAAAEGELVSFYVAVQPSDSAQAVLVRLTVAATTTQEVASQELVPPAESPGLAPLALLAALVLAVRRRHA